MYLTVLLKSVKMRKARYALTVIALMIGASIGSALIMVSLSISDKVDEQVLDYGPNLVVVPHSEDIEITIGGVPLATITETKYIAQQDAEQIRDLPLDVFGDKVKGIKGRNAFVYSIVQVEPKGGMSGDMGTRQDGMEEKTMASVLLAGTWFDQLQEINTWWMMMEGDYPSNDNEVVLGMTAAMRLGISVGDEMDFEYKEILSNETGKHEFTSSRTFLVSGIVDTGGDDDSMIFGNLVAVQAFTNKVNKVNIMHISALCNACPLEDIAVIIEDVFNGTVDVRTVKQTAMAQMKTLEMVENLVGFITVVALGASGLAVMTTMSLTVVERRKEIALMKAIGASKARIAGMFMGEGIVLAVIGGLLGFVFGILVAQGIGQFVFQSSIQVIPWVIPISVAGSLGIVVLASVWPIKRAMVFDPAVILRGE